MVVKAPLAICLKSELRACWQAVPVAVRSIGRGSEVLGCQVGVLTKLGLSRGGAKFEMFDSVVCQVLGSDPSGQQLRASELATQYAGNSDEDKPVM